MSKNVGVFVDVANIFYAAKAAGTDIDYVTLLKSAIAGRDFVRAYAYTGLDPENENQRQFHSFLARNGYKVISKDIRKYGDGRIKANLDIELVVDMMRMARNLDIVVVVSGDGDFAPAIRAVQQMGVRVEVISFRGNTSSDLIEVADTFTDIAQIARVDKGSARSGRRVAAEGDLSMTQVPEKETEGAPRRRRGARVRTGEREERPAAVAETAGMPGNLIVLPGERLSRAPEDGESEDEMAADEPMVEELAASEELLAGNGDDLEARRRRRRRGGRGRGRGRREAEGTPVEADAQPREDAQPRQEEEEEEFEEVGPSQLPHHTFGSVWDTQLGVPTAPLAALGDEAIADEDDDFDEPEIPEYLLAERRQRGQQRGPQRGRLGGRGRGGAGYQAAVERERYGRGGATGFGGARPPERPRTDRPRGGGGGGGAGRPPQRTGRPPERAQRDQRGPERQPAMGSSGQPWSEVPPEMEEMLRAEMARHAPAGARPAGRDMAMPPPTEAPVEVAAKPRAPRRRPATSTSPATGTAAALAVEPPVPADKPARTRRRSTATAVAEPSGAAATTDATAVTSKPRRASRTKAASASPEEAGSTNPPEAPSEGASKPVRRRRTKAAEGGEGDTS